MKTPEQKAEAKRQARRAARFKHIMEVMRTLSSVCSLAMNAVVFIYIYMKQIHPH